MATDKKKTPKHCGFEAPAIGHVLPDDYVKVVKPNGSVLFLPPKEAAKYMKASKKPTSKK